MGKEVKTLILIFDGGGSMVQRKDILKRHATRRTTAEEPSGDDSDSHTAWNEHRAALERKHVKIVFTSRKQGG